MDNGTRLAAVDLGSNSFRLEIGRVDHGQFYRSEYLKETIRQGNGLDENRNLTPQAMQKGWDCLARFGERLAGFEAHQVRAVATQTLREARNRDEFLAKANTLLGFPIDVISGQEEARLIYQGVAQALPKGNERRLVIDIGGRSTELILGQGTEPKLMESYRVGSIAWSTRYFPQGVFSSKTIETAEIAAKAVLDEALNAYRRDTWDVAYGSAGTVNAVSEVLLANGWPAGVVTAPGLDWLIERLIAAQSADRLRLTGMKEERRAIIGGGVSILRAIFSLLQIEEMYIAIGGLRHGLLTELLGTLHGEADIRVRTVDRLTSIFGADKVHGTRVSTVSKHFFAQLQAQKPKQRQLTDERLSRKLGWAGQLHEIGCQISHSDSHKHGAYILQNSDAMGFSLSELQTLSLLVLGHRGKLRKLETHLEDATLVQQLLALRLAIALCHARRDPDLNGLKLSRDLGRSNAFVLSYQTRWARAYPQSAHLLREEVANWQKTPWSLFLDEY